MKTTNLKTLWLVLVMLCTSICASAFDFEVDGIYYNITSSTDLTCEVASAYRGGDVTIPSVVIYNSKEYKVTSIGLFAFSDCSSLTTVNIPEGVTSIGTAAFRGCSSLTEVNIPESVTSIGGIAFYECSSLTTVNIKNIATWCNINFESEESNPLFYANNIYLNGELVTKLDIPEEVTSIGRYAFYSCSSLTTVNIPEGVTSIGTAAFRGCSSLTEVNIPESVTSIGGIAFYECSSLTTVNIKNIATWCNINFESEESNPLFYANNIYLNGELVTKLDIPEEVTSIGNYAFSSCFSLTTVNIPEGVTRIGRYAFGNTRIDYITINSETPIEMYNSFNGAFIIVPNTALGAYKSAWNQYSNRILSTSEAFITANVTATDGHPALLNAIGGVGSEEKVLKLKINGTINGYDIMLLRNKLTNLIYLDLTDATIVPEKDNYQYYTGYYTKENVLGDYSFYNIQKLQTVVLPNNITSIGSHAFANCYHLVQVLNIPESCTNIGEGAFGSDWNLHVCDISNGRKDIGNYAFSNCTNLKDVVINGNIGNCAFQGSGVENVTIKKDAKSIGNSTFYDCSSLVNLKFEEGLETIGSFAFSGCKSLNTLRLPSSLKRIEGSAFQSCSSLKEIHIPSMLESIGNNAFTGTGATDVYSYTLSPISIAQNSFNYNGVTLHAPQEPESVFWDYYQNTQWSQFTNVVPFDAKYSTWYTEEGKDITLEDGETIPNDEEAEEPTGEMNPGSGIDYKPGSWQWLYELIMKWTGGKFPSFIDNSSVFVDNLTFKLQVSAGKWYFFCFPFNVELEQVKYPGRQKVWRYYDGKERAENSKGGWKNVTENVLHAGQGYIFQTNKAGEIEITIKNPIFTGGDKQVTITNHTSANIEDASWNFIGNPNLSYYDLGALANEYNCPITVWDSQNNTYNAVMPGDDDYQFHPFEAFFVQKPDGVNSVDFKAENRITSNGAEKVMQARRRARAAMKIDENRLLINLAISNGEQTDKTRVVFNDEKSMDYETACDASKFLSTEAPQIYSLDSKNIKYSINERPKADKTVSLGIYAPAEGVYTISAQRMDCRMALKDNVTGTIHDLSEGDYEFLTEAGTYEARFTLIPNEEEATGIDLAKIVGTDATIYSTNGTAVGNSNGQVNAPAGVYVVKEGNKVRKVLVK